MLYGPPVPLVSINVKLVPVFICGNGFIILKVVFPSSVAVNTFPSSRFIVAEPETPPRFETTSPYCFSTRSVTTEPLKVLFAFASILVNDAAALVVPPITVLSMVPSLIVAKSIVAAPVTSKSFPFEIVTVPFIFVSPPTHSCLEIPTPPETTKDPVFVELDSVVPNILTLEVILALARFTVSAFPNAFTWVTPEFNKLNVPLEEDEY